MNPVIHHFRKEFLYLRFRWVGYLLILFLELAVYLEWLVPIRAGVTDPDWIKFLPAIVLLSGLSLLISCPEDRPGSDQSFISTRPMPLRAYWLSRLLVWALLIILPALVQNGLYLFLSERPFGEILRGTAERFVSVAGYTASLIPALALWRRNEIWKATLILVPSLYLASKLINFLVFKLGEIQFVHPDTLHLTAPAWGLFALLTGLIAWNHLANALTFRRRVTLTILAGILALVASRSKFLFDTTPDFYDQDLVQELAPGMKVDFDLGEARFEGTERDFGPLLRGHVPEVLVGEKVHVSLRPQRSLFLQGRTQWEAENTDKFSYMGWESPARQVQHGDLILRDFFPEDTVFMPFHPDWSDWSDNEQALTSLATFPDGSLPDFNQPLEIETDFVVDWFQRDLAMEIPLEEGASADCGEVRWKLLRVSPQDGPQPGNLSIFLQRESNTREDPGTGYAILLHLAGEGIVRLDPAKQKGHGVRAAKTGWQRSQIELTWNHVFNHADGEPTGVDLSKAKLILLRSRYLGQSSANWKSSAFRLADIPSMWGTELPWMQARTLYSGREKKAFLERVATLTPPTESSSPEEARRYAYDLFQAASITNSVYKNFVHNDIAEAFEPLGEHHLSLLLELRAHSWPGWTNRPPNSLFTRYVTEEQRDVLVERALENVMVANLVVEKGWSDLAKESHLDQLLDTPALDDAGRALLLDWIEDDSVAEKLLQSAPHDFRGYIIRALDERPETRDAVEEVVQDKFEETLLLLTSHNAGSIVQRAANFGSEQALTLSLKWLGLSGDMERSYPPYPSFLEADGTNFWKSGRIPDHERASFFRKLQASEFEYVPEERAWKLKKP